MSIQPIDHTLSLPDEAILHILSYLDAQELAQSTRVSKAWQRVASDDTLWRKLCHGMKELPETGVKDFIASRAVVSIKGLLKRVEAFTLKVPLDQKWHWCCVFPSNPDCWIRVWMRTGNVTWKSIASTTEICFFLKKFDEVTLPVIPHTLASAFSVTRVFVPEMAETQNLESAIDHILVRRGIQFERGSSRRKRINLITTAGVVAAVALLLYYSNSPYIYSPLFKQVASLSVLGIFTYRYLSIL